MDVFLEKPQVDDLERAERHELEPRRRPEDGCHSTREQQASQGSQCKRQGDGHRAVGRRYL